MIIGLNKFKLMKYRIKHITNTNNLGNITSEYYIIQSFILLWWINTSIPSIHTTDNYVIFDSKSIGFHNLKDAEKVIEYLKDSRTYYYENATIEKYLVYEFNHRIGEELKFVYIIDYLTKHNFDQFYTTPLFNSINEAIKLIDKQIITKKQVIIQ